MYVSYLVPISKYLERSTNDEASDDIIFLIILYLLTHFNQNPKYSLVRHFQHVFSLPGGEETLIV
jgi:hypothetical protein